MIQKSEEWVKADLHMHTIYSKEPKVLGMTSRALYTPDKLIKTAIKRGLDSIAITDHDTVKGALIGKEWLKLSGIKDFNLIIGEEVTTKDGHILAIDIKEDIPMMLSAEETLDIIKDQGGLAIIPHPFTPLGLKKKIYSIKFAGIEVFNPFAWVQMKNKKAKIACGELNVAPISNSDAHTLGVVGKCYTEYETFDNTTNAIKKCIRSRHTHPVNLLSRRRALATLMLNGLLVFRNLRNRHV